MESLKLKHIIFLFLFVPLFLQGQEDKLCVHDLKNNPLSVKNFAKKNYSKEKDVIYFVEDEKSSNTGRLIVNLSTLSQNTITLSWQNTCVNKVKTSWFARLQYRLSTNDEWKDVTDSKGRAIAYTTTYKRYAKNFDDVELPAVCENKDFVQLSWLVSTNGSKAKSPEILFRNIEIKSLYDKYSGVAAKVKVSANDDEEINTIVFNNISLPYTFPEEKRIKIAGEFIRDSINIEIMGEDADYFAISSTSISEKQAKNGKTISLSYKPKKEGRHKAVLRISTSKLARDITIPVEASAANHKDYNKNLLPQEQEASTEYNYRIPVFSNTDYQFRFDLDTTLKVTIKYKWYRNNKMLFSMQDTVKSQSYCVPLKSPQEANSLEIVLKANKAFSMNNAYLGSPKVKRMIRSGSWSDEQNWENNTTPVMEDFVLIDKGVTAEVDEDVACAFLILLDSANVHLKTGKTFYVSSDIFYNKKSFFTVEQYLLPEKWNYISSPINQAPAAMFSMKSTNNDTWLMQYNTGKMSKNNDYWSDYITDPKFSLVPGRGYAVYTNDALKVEYEGLLCSSSVNLPLVSTPNDKWNLVGNPYTAPLSSKRLYEDIAGKIQGNVIMLFDRESQTYNPIIVDPNEEITIPSLQSFFVEALSVPTEITLKRTHQYIPSTEEQSEINHNYLNLSVSNGMLQTYALLGMVDEAEYSFDEYDCHKMFGNNEHMPEIYLTDGNDEYSVNVFPTYPAIYNIGLYIGNPDEVEINLNNISVLPEGVVVLIEDLTDNTFVDFCKEGSIKTLLQTGTTEDYRIHILKTLQLQEFKNNNSGVYLWHDNGRVLVYAEEYTKLQQVRLTNKRTKQETEITYTSNKVMQSELEKGLYSADILVDGKWIKNIDFQVK